MAGEKPPTGPTNGKGNGKRQEGQSIEDQLRAKGIAKGIDVDAILAEARAKDSLNGEPTPTPQEETVSETSTGKPNTNPSIEETLKKSPTEIVSKLHELQIKAKSTERAKITRLVDAIQQLPRVPERKKGKRIAQLAKRASEFIGEAPSTPTATENETPEAPEIIVNNDNPPKTPEKPPSIPKEPSLKDRVITLANYLDVSAEEGKEIDGFIRQLNVLINRENLSRKEKAIYENAQRKLEEIANRLDKRLMKRDDPSVREKKPSDITPIILNQTPPTKPKDEESFTYRPWTEDDQKNLDEINKGKNPDNKEVVKPHSGENAEGLEEALDAFIAEQEQKSNKRPVREKKRGGQQPQNEKGKDLIKVIPREEKKPDEKKEGEFDGWLEDLEELKSLLKKYPEYMRNGLAEDFREKLDKSEEILRKSDRTEEENKFLRKRKIPEVLKALKESIENDKKREAGQEKGAPTSQASSFEELLKKESPNKKEEEIQPVRPENKENKETAEEALARTRKEYAEAYKPYMEADREKSAWRRLGKRAKLVFSDERIAIEKELSDKKAAYDAAKIARAKEVRAEKEKELLDGYAQRGKEGTLKPEDKVNLQKFILDEFVNKERDILTKEKVGMFPPKKESLFKRGFKKYGEWVNDGKYKWTRRLGSTILLIGAGTAATGFTLGWTSYDMTRRFLFGSTGALAAQGVGLGYQKYRDQKLSKIEEKQMSDLRSMVTPENLPEAMRIYERFLTEKDSFKRKTMIRKIIAMTTTSVATGAGLEAVYQELYGNIPQPTPEVSRPGSPDTRPSLGHETDDMLRSPDRVASPDNNLTPGDNYDDQAWMRAVQPDLGPDGMREQDIIANPERRGAGATPQPTEPAQGVRRPRVARVPVDSIPPNPLTPDLNAPQPEILREIPTLSPENLNKIFEDTVNQKLGNPGIFGWGKTNGFQSEIWTQTSHRKVGEILSLMPSDTKDAIGLNSLDTAKLQQWLQELSQQSGLKPGANETVEKFLRRAITKTAV